MIPCLGVKKYFTRRHYLLMTAKDKEKYKERANMLLI